MSLFQEVQYDRLQSGLISYIFIAFISVQLKTIQTIILEITNLNTYPDDSSDLQAVVINLF
jgi:hypothetical protein